MNNTFNFAQFFSFLFYEIKHLFGFDFLRKYYFLLRKRQIKKN